jgi:CHASE2 domain-containing sensor protein
LSTDPPHRPLRSRLLRALPVLLLTLGFSVLLDRSEEAEWAALDFQARLRPVAAQSDVVVVRINDADHDTLFGGVTPLDPATVLRVVDAIARGRPKVIGVDLESGAPAYAVVPDSVRGVPVVWARDARCVDGDGNPLAACEPQDLKLGGVRGRTGPVRQTGMALLSPDGDGTLRRYRQSLGTASDAQPTFATALLRAAEDSLPPGRERLITYRPLPVQPLTAGWVLANENSADYLGDAGVLKGKRVLLGAAHSATRDWHNTPLGLKAGVEVWAQVVDSELRGGGTAPPHPVWVGVLQFAAAVGLVLLFHLLPLERAVWAGVVAVPVGSGLCSLAAFGSPWFWMYFVPILVLLLVQQLYDVAKNYRDALLTATLPQPIAPTAPRTPLPVTEQTGHAPASAPEWTTERARGRAHE